MKAIAHTSCEQSQAKWPRLMNMIIKGHVKTSFCHFHRSHWNREHLPDVLDGRILTLCWTEPEMAAVIL